MSKANLKKSVIIDCSHVLSNESPVYPNDTPLHINYIKSFHKDGYTLSEVTTSMHVGTHIDAPSHLTPLQTTMKDFKLESGVTQGIVCNVVGQMEIILDNSQLDRIQENDSVLLYTGWDQYYKSERYYKHPTVSLETAKKLISKKISMLIIDMPSPDHYPFKVHHLLMSNDVWLVENATNLNELNPSKRYQVYAIPIKIQAEAALARVFAMEIDEHLR